MVTRKVESRDGTEIAYHLVGRGPRAWLMPPAMGAPLLSMKHLLERFGRDFTIVSWDMRGFYGSAAPADRRAYRFEDHVDDMLAVRRAAGVTDFVLGGWSMGVQLSLEYYRRAPHDVRALVLINGPFERALTGVLPFAVPGAELAVDGAILAGRLVSPALNLLSRRLLGAKGAAKVLAAAGVVAANAPFFEEVLAEFHRIDWGRYIEVMRGLHDHSAADVLRTVRVPTLITAGTHDVMTPVRVARRLHEGIAGSELVVIEKATHYLPTEFPDRLNDAIERFLDRIERPSVRPAAVAGAASAK
jgi:pimeloyl-ACP methyl ester carboxylesterase